MQDEGEHWILTPSGHKEALAMLESLGQAG